MKASTKSLKPGPFLLSLMLTFNWHSSTAGHALVSYLNTS